MILKWLTFVMLQKKTLKNDPDCPRILMIHTEY